MSYTWGVLQTDKTNIFFGSVYWGLFVTLFIGIPTYLVLNYYNYDIPIWVGIIFTIIVFPISTYSFYRAGCKRAKKKQ